MKARCRALFVILSKRRNYAYGVENLMVAKDSIVPVAMDGRPMATAYLIACNIAKMLIRH